MFKKLFKIITQSDNNDKQEDSDASSIAATIILQDLDLSIQTHIDTFSKQWDAYLVKMDSKYTAEGKKYNMLEYAILNGYLKTADALLQVSELQISDKYLSKNIIDYLIYLYVEDQDPANMLLALQLADAGAILPVEENRDFPGLFALMRSENDVHLDLLDQIILLHHRDKGLLRYLRIYDKAQGSLKMLAHILSLCTKHYIKISEHYVNAFMWCAMKGYHEELELLVKYASAEHLNAISNTGFSALAYAAANNDVFAAKLLLSKDQNKEKNINTRDKKYKMTPISYAIWHQNREMIDLFINNIEKLSDYHQSLLDSFNAEEKKEAAKKAKSKAKKKRQAEARKERKQNHVEDALAIDATNAMEEKDKKEVIEKDVQKAEESALSALLSFIGDSIIPQNDKGNSRRLKVFEELCSRDVPADDDDYTYIKKSIAALLSLQERDEKNSICK